MNGNNSTSAAGQQGTGGRRRKQSERNQQSEMRCGDQVKGDEGLPTAGQERTEKEEGQGTEEGERMIQSLGPHSHHGDPTVKHHFLN